MDHPPRRARWAWLCSILMIHLALVTPGLVAHFASPQRVARFGADDPRPVPPEWRDADGYHLPVVDTMRAQWPRIDIVHYDSATAPGYHAFMATVAIALAGRTDPVDPMLWILNTLVGLALIAAIFATGARFARPPTAFLLALPMACSSYVVAASTWLTTDNAAMLFVTLALGGAVTGRMTAWRGVRFGIYGALATSIRQNCAWIAAPIALAALLASPIRWLAPRAYAHDEPPEGWRAAVGGAIGALLPLGLVVFLIVQWGGLLPKSSDGWSEHHNLGPNPAAPSYALALFASFGFFFAPIAWRALAGVRKAPKAPLLCAAIAFAAAIAAPTASTRSLFPEGTPEWKMRNYGVLWRMVDEAPTIADRSLLIALLAPAGAVLLIAFYRAACAARRGPQALLLLTSLIGWLAAQTMNSMAWQRYFEPITLLALAWLSAMCWAHAWSIAPPPRRRLMLAGPLVLAIALTGITALKLHRPSIAVAFGAERTTPQQPTPFAAPPP